MEILPKADPGPAPSHVIFWGGGREELSSKFGLHNTQIYFNIFYSLLSLQKDKRGIKTILSKNSTTPGLHPKIPQILDPPLITTAAVMCGHKMLQ